MYIQKISKAYGNDARRELGPNAAICASGYIPGILTLSRRCRKKVKSGKEVGDLMFIIINVWEEKILILGMIPQGWEPYHLYNCDCQQS